jgi:sugar (pentulose or hexulose) kinase
MRSAAAVHGPTQLVRAAEDGGVFEVRLGIDALRAIGASVTTVITAGGPSGSARLMQLRDDAWGAQAGSSADSHVTLRGAARRSPGPWPLAASPTPERRRLPWCRHCSGIARSPLRRGMLSIVTGDGARS